MLALVYLLQWIVMILHFSVFQTSCMLAQSKRDFPHPYLPTIIKLLFLFSQYETILISFFISLVRYIVCTPENSSSLYSDIFPLLIFRQSGSLSPGTLFPKTAQKTIPLVSLSKLEASPFTKFNLNSCSFTESSINDKAFLTSPTLVVETNCF